MLTFLGAFFVCKTITACYDWLSFLRLWRLHGCYCFIGGGFLTPVARRLFLSPGSPAARSVAGGMPVAATGGTCASAHDCASSVLGNPKSLPDRLKSKSGSGRRFLVCRYLVTRKRAFSSADRLLIGDVKVGLFSWFFPILTF